MKQLQDQLFKITQFVFDNEKSFVEEFNLLAFCDFINVFFSGSKVYIKYDTAMCGVQVKWLSTQDVFDWMEDQGFEL